MKHVIANGLTKK